MNLPNDEKYQKEKNIMELIIREQTTPRTIEEAIQNAIQESHSHDLSLDLADDAQALRRIIRNHVRDFLAQKFGAAMMDPKKHAHVEELWQKIFPEEK